MEESRTHPEPAERDRPVERPEPGEPTPAERDEAERAELAGRALGRGPRAKGKAARDTAVWTSVVVFLLAATAFLVFVVQNTEQVDVEWTIWSVGVSLAAVVFGAMLLGSVLTLATGAIWRFRRRRRLREREELDRLRGD